jgi:hypothetical protein
MAPISKYHLEWNLWCRPVDSGRLGWCYSSWKSKHWSLCHLTHETDMAVQDFWSVYHDQLDFLSTVNSEEIHMRTTTEVRTHQVASALLFGMDPATSKRPWPVYTQPQSVRNLFLCECSIWLFRLDWFFGSKLSVSDGRCNTGRIPVSSGMDEPFDAEYGPESQAWCYSRYYWFKCLGNMVYVNILHVSSTSKLTVVF